jgi:hypothetical protein
MTTKNLLTANNNLENAIKGGDVDEALKWLEVINRLNNLMPETTKSNAHNITWGDIKHLIPSLCNVKLMIIFEENKIEQICITNGAPRYDDAVIIKYIFSKFI